MAKAPKGQRAKPTRGCGATAAAACAFVLGVWPVAALATTGNAPPAPAPLPLTDPQFWIVTIAAVCAGAWIVWRMLPKSLLFKHRKPPAKPATLTVGGKAVEAKPKPQPKPKCH